jgi:hypothetical protein
VVECSVADGINPVVRRTALFLIHGSPVADQATTTSAHGDLTVHAGQIDVRIDGWNAYHSLDGRAPLHGMVPRASRLVLANLAFQRPSPVPSSGTGSPLPPITPRRRRPTEPSRCGATISVVDDHHRWRGDLIPERT